MPLNVSSLPICTPYDPAADAAGSADPLGTAGGSEQLAEVILPGLTARMWRARLLTLAVIAADIADAVIKDVDDEEQRRLDAVLAFERLYVSSLVRNEENDRTIARRVPGSRTARRALHADEPLTKQNFIKGQAVNGPSGVMNRLARQLGLLNDDGKVSNRGNDLKSAWYRKIAETEKLDAADGGELYRLARKHVRGGPWPGRKAPIWDLLVQQLRPDKIPKSERTLIERLLRADPEFGIRGRFVDLLLDKRCQAFHSQASNFDGRGQVEETVLLKGVRPLIGSGPIDEAISVALQAIEVYEQFSVVFASVFDRVLWILRSAGGSVSADEVLPKARIYSGWDELRSQLTKVVTKARDLLPSISHLEVFNRQRVPSLMERVLEDAERGATDLDCLIEAALTRHERVHREKRKPTWVDRSKKWTLMPGTPVVQDPFSRPSNGFVHPYRVINAYSLLYDLGLTNKRVESDGEDDQQ